jgi:hypothetical protein
MNWLLIALVFVVIFAMSQKTPSKSSSSTPGADEDVEQPTAEETATKPHVEKTVKIQTMNNATMHTVTHGSKVIELGSLTHSGELKGIKLIATAKEQGRGNKCSLFTLSVMRGEKSIAKVVQRLGRQGSYKAFSLDPAINSGTMVQAGDSVRMTITGLWPACSTWIKNIVANISVLA